MLRTPNLDDQRFADIVEEAVKSIPYIYPEWTDHNAHDPGITMLELFAWYKEMQQYHLNCSTSKAMDMYIKLLGMRRVDIEPAKAVVALEKLDQSLQVHAGDEMVVTGGTTFTFDKDGVYGLTRVRHLVLEGRTRTDLSELVLHDHLKISVFREQGARLWLGVEHDEPLEQLEMFISLADDYPVRRNPFEAGQAPGKRVRITGADGAELSTVLDETYALSMSGRLVLNVAGQKDSDAMGMGQMLWICIELVDAGCEELPELTGVSSCFAGITQANHLVRHTDETLAGRHIEVPRKGLLEHEGKCLMLARDEWGWRQVPAISYHADAVTADVDFDLAQDGEPNVRAVFYEEWMAPYLTADGAGESGFAWPLPMNEQLPDAARIGVMGLCDTRGGRRYEKWEYTLALDELTPFDKCYEFDPEAAALRFGDNIRGEIAPKGKDALILTDYAITLADQGRFPVRQELQLGQRTITARAVAFVDGKARESTDAVRARLMKRLKGVSRAVTEQDYADIAKKTPGLRVMQAGAIAGYDAQTGRESASCVSVAVLPYSKEVYPEPDANFIKQVKKKMDAVRPICTQVKVVPPLYIRLNISATVFAAHGVGDVQSAVGSALHAYFRPTQEKWLLGERILEADIAGVIGSVPGVLGVKNLTITADSARAGRTAAGDILLPLHALPCLGTLEIYK